MAIGKSPTDSRHSKWQFSIPSPVAATTMRQRYHAIYNFLIIISILYGYF
jgi:hypothetical protein